MVLDTNLIATESEKLWIYLTKIRIFDWAMEYAL